MATKFGVMVPQGWRMDLADIPIPVEAHAGDDPRRARGRRTVS